MCTDIDPPGLVDDWGAADAFRALHRDRAVVYLSDAVHPRQRAGGKSLFVAKPFAELATLASTTGARAAG